MGYQMISDMFQSVLGLDISNLSANTPLTMSDAKTGDKSDYNKIIGLPPQIYYSNGIAKEMIANKILQSMLVMDVTPAIPKFAGFQGDTGLNLYTVDTASGTERYLELFSKFPDRMRLTESDVPIKIAASLDTPVEETWSTQFGDSMIEMGLNAFLGSSLMGEGRFITGQNSGSGMVGEISKGLAQGVSDEMGNSKPGNFLGNMVGLGGKAMSENMAKVEKTIHGPSNSARKGAFQMMIGSQMDFPKVWKGSSFEPSYSFKIQFINPYPNDDVSYIKYIINPISKLLGFMCPISDSNWTFSFPIMCKVECPGLFTLDGAYVQNLSLIKGGDNNDLTYFQRPNAVTAQITFGSIYSTMVAKIAGESKEDRPTMIGYLNTLRGFTTFPWDIYTEDDMYKKYFNNVMQESLNQQLLDKSSPNPQTQQTPANDSRVPIVYSEAMSDPYLNPNGVPSDKLKSYKTDFDNFSSTNNRQPNVQDRIALQIKNEINPQNAETMNWFQQNYNSFDDTTKNILGPNYFEKDFQEDPTSYTPVENSVIL